MLKIPETLVTLARDHVQSDCFEKRKHVAQKELQSHHIGPMGKGSDEQQPSWLRRLRRGLEALQVDAVGNRHRALNQATIQFRHRDHAIHLSPCCGLKSGPQFAGTKVPTFDEALELARGKIGIYVDVKQASAKDLVTHIDGHGMTDNVVIYAGLRLSKEIQALNPKLKVMPESQSESAVKQLIEELHPLVIAFGARDFTPEIIRLTKEAHAEIYVDRMGATDNPAGWQSAIDAGADGIQTDRPGELVKFLREKGYKQP